MIRLTRLNNRPLVVNSDLIKFIENAPDTVITLVSGEKIVVLETAQEVINRVVEYRRQLRVPITAAVPAEDTAEEFNEREEPKTAAKRGDMSEEDE
jgi:flagellar protein FlbD